MIKTYVIIQRCFNVNEDYSYQFSFFKDIAGADNVQRSKTRPCIRFRRGHIRRSHCISGHDHSHDTQLLLRVVIDHIQFYSTIRKQQIEIDNMKTIIEEFQSSSNMLDDQLTNVTLGVQNIQYLLRKIALEKDMEMDGIPKEQ